MQADQNEESLVVLRQGVVQGSFTVAEIKEMLTRGELLHSDSVIIDGEPHVLSSLTPPIRSTPRRQSRR